MSIPDALSEEAPRASPARATEILAPFRVVISRCPEKIPRGGSGGFICALMRACQDCLGPFPLNVATQGEDCRSVSHLGGKNVAFRPRPACSLHWWRRAGRGRPREPRCSLAAPLGPPYASLALFRAKHQLQLCSLSCASHAFSLAPSGHLYLGPSGSSSPPACCLPPRHPCRPTPSRTPS